MIYYTPKEFSEALDGLLSRSTITDRCNNGEIKAIRLGGKGSRFKIPETELFRIQKESGLEAIENSKRYNYKNNSL